MTQVRVHADDSEWQRGIDGLLARLWRATHVATGQGTLLVEREGKRRLRRYTHPRGTPTPSPAGVGPPALVTGHLRRTWKTVPPYPGRKPWTVRARTGPTAIYARIQELGGVIRQTRTRRVRTTRPDGSTLERVVPFVHEFTLPKRPYARPTVLDNRRSIYRLYVEYWTRAIVFR